MKKLILPLLMIINGCIGTDIIDDEVPEMLVIESTITSLKVGETHQFAAKYFNNIGEETPVTFSWSSSDDAVIAIDDTGLATAVSEGKATITVEAQGLTDAIELTTGGQTGGTVDERTASLTPVSSYPLSGEVTLKKGGSGLVLSFSSDFNTTSALPGLYVYLSNNTNTINGALEVGKVQQYSGAQSYQIGITDDLYAYNFVLFYCKPFVVPVGNGAFKP